MCVLVGLAPPLAAQPPAHPVRAASKGPASPAAHLSPRACTDECYHELHPVPTHHPGTHSFSAGRADAGGLTTPPSAPLSPSVHPSTPLSRYLCRPTAPLSPPHPAATPSAPISLSKPPPPPPLSSQGGRPPPPRAALSADIRRRTCIWARGFCTGRVLTVLWVSGSRRPEGPDGRAVGQLWAL